MLGLDPARAEGLIYLVAVLLAVSVLTLPWLRIGIGRILGYAAAWAVIFGGAWLLIERTQPGVRGWITEAAREPDPRVAELALPEGHPQVEGLSGPTGGEVRVPAAPDGHFWVRASVNGQSVRFLVDTGASDVVLSRATARRVGIDVDGLRYDRIGMAAGGPVRAASARIERLVVGPIARDDMPVSVLDSPADINLLGMRFLRTLDSFAIERGEMVLRS
ncbi:MAG: TIGR02281 family clan AA aspartic protease [Sphingomonadaceae bacterium]